MPNGSKAHQHFVLPVTKKGKVSQKGASKSWTHVHAFAESKHAHDLIKMCKIVECDGYEKHGAHVS